MSWNITPGTWDEQTYAWDDQIYVMTVPASAGVDFQVQTVTTIYRDFTVEANSGVSLDFTGIELTYEFQIDKVSGTRLIVEDIVYQEALDVDSEAGVSFEVTYLLWSEKSGATGAWTPEASL